MLPRNLDSSGPISSLTWNDLANGVPTIVALARLCSDQLAKSDLPETSVNELPDEARAILHCAVNSGSICIRGDKNAFDPSQRFLAICVEKQEGQRIEFRCVGDPEQTIRFVDGFRQLCRAGLVMHQLMNDFSLTGRGFELARSVDSEDVEALIELGNVVV